MEGKTDTGCCPIRALTYSFLLASLPVAASAGDNWISFDGRFSAGYSSRVAGAEAFLTGDATARLSFGRFGAELGVYGRADALDTPHETYGTLTLDIGTSGRLSVGVPRPAYDSFAVSALELAFPAMAVDRAGQTRSAATQGSMFANWLPYGARFENHSGELKYAVSVHSAAAPGATTASVGVGIDNGPWALSGALELVDGDPSVKAQVVRTFDSLSAGLGLYAPKIAGVSDMVELFATAQPWDRLSVTGIVQVPTDGSSMTGGLAGRFSVREGLDISVGVASDAGGDPFANAFVDFRF